MATKGKSGGGSKGTATPSKVQAQREAAARIEAEKLTAPQEADDGEQIVPKGEPKTLAEKLREIDDSVAAQVRAQKLRIAQEAERDARTAFQAYVDESDDDDLKARWKAIAEATRMVRQFIEGAGTTGGQTTLFGGAPAARKPAAAKSDLSPEDAEAKTREVIAYLGKAGDWVSTNAVAKEVGYSKLAGLLAGEINEGRVERRGQGRATEFRAK